MNGPAGRLSAVTAVITAVIARLMTSASPAMVTTYRGMIWPHLMAKYRGVCLVGEFPIHWNEIYLGCGQNHLVGQFDFK